MKKFFNSTTISVGLAVFSMLFGAGNLVYPALVGITSGDQYLVGILGFILTAVCLPVAGLVSMIFFNGNYYDFFGRLGKIPGKMCIFLCILIIGPFLAIPRIVTLSHVMVAPFLPTSLSTITPWSSFIYSIIFFGLTFLAAFRKSNIIKILGNFISPLLLVSLLIIIIKGIFTAETTFQNSASLIYTFKENIKLGYATLDLFGAIFFASIVLNAIKRNSKQNNQSLRQQAIIGLKSGIIGTSLLSIIYIGINYIAAFHGQECSFSNIGELFREVSFKILNQHGGIIISLAVFMACYSTAISLAAVIATFVRHEIFHKKISFISALLISLLACIPLSTAGLGTVLNLTAGPITYIGYPALIVLTFLNLAYKLWNFKPVKIPVFTTFLAMLILYIYQYL